MLNVYNSRTKNHRVLKFGGLRSKMKNLSSGEIEAVNNDWIHFNHKWVAIWTYYTLMFLNLVPGNITIKERPFNVGKKANWFEGTPQGGIGREEWNGNGERGRVVMWGDWGTAAPVMHYWNYYQPTTTTTLSFILLINNALIHIWCTYINDHIFLCNFNGALRNNLLNA